MVAADTIRTLPHPPCLDRSNNMLGCLCKKLSYVMFQHLDDVEPPGIILSLNGLTVNNESVISCQSQFTY